MLDGNVALVTGGGSGIGRALCRELLKKGARVVVWDMASQGLDSLSEEASQQGWECTTERIDVTSRAQVKEAAEKNVTQWGSIDFWFNNAGIAGLGSFVETDPLLVKRVIDTNLTALMLGTQVAIELMERRGAGRIINVASVAGILPAPYLTTYSAAKHGVVGFTRALRDELKLRDSPVKLHLVAPGFVDTAMIQRGQALGFPEWLSWALSTPERVAQETLRGVLRDEAEIYPTWNGRLLLGAQRLVPSFAAKAARLLLVQRPIDLLLNRYTVD